MDSSDEKSNSHFSTGTSSNSSTLINLSEFVESRLPLIREDYFTRNKNVAEAIKIDMQLPEMAADRLEPMCDVSLLNNEEQQRSINSLDDLNSDCLSLLDFVKTNFDKSVKRNHPYEIKFLKNLAKLNELEPDKPGDLIHTPDFIATVQISQGLNSRLSKLAWSEDYLVLGQNYLSDLKDKISCFRQEVRIGEFSSNPEQVKSAPIMKDVIQSSYFLIEDVLYEDTRHGPTDFAQSVLEWSRTNLESSFSKKPMQETRFDYLSVRMGFPYLYKHVGSCEHLLIFTSVKLVNPKSDCYLLSKYPIPRDKTRGRFTFCWCCNRLYAKWVVCNSTMAVDDPTFLCERCFRNSQYELVSEEVTEQIQSDKTDKTTSEAITEAINEETAAETTADILKVIDQAEFEKRNPGLKKICDFKAYHFSQL